MIMAAINQVDEGVSEADRKEDDRTARESYKDKHKTEAFSAMRDAVQPEPAPRRHRTRPGPLRRLPRRPREGAEGQAGHRRLHHRGPARDAPL